MNPSHRQGGYRVRFDWGLTGAVAIADGAEVAVVVDVLSFTTTVSVALDRGTAVLPYRWGDRGAESYARQHDAALAVGRSQAATGGLSLSPLTVRTHPTPPSRLVLPSPNGSSIAHYLATAGSDCLAGCLRNAVAVASWLDAADSATVAFIAAGERWPDGGLRPAVEDAWGAGAVIGELVRLGWTGLSPEAEFAVAAYEGVRGQELRALQRCASGLELVNRGYRGDVEIAAELDQSSSVPRLSDGQFITA
ncbi:MAG: 2-phosphosulfolactate phosphatase [Actinomycetota bacterium]|nr:2-phosphosulfolactate phosphatase [Actinomycetota bacterium]MDQ2956168.1 2-phosphosulfolactate phosphatase [Actinomycetota bacterium]